MLLKLGSVTTANASSILPKHGQDLSCFFERLRNQISQDTGITALAIVGFKLLGWDRKTAISILVMYTTFSCKYMACILYMPGKVSRDMKAAVYTAVLQ